MHLGMAEEYIKENTEIWEQGKEAEEMLSEKLMIIEMLEKDLVMYRKQNEELDERVLQLEKLVKLIENKRSNAGTSNVSNASNKSREAEQSLQKYIVLFNESQTKLAQAEKRIQTIQTESRKTSPV